MSTYRDASISVFFSVSLIAPVAVSCTVPSAGVNIIAIAVVVAVPVIVVASLSPEANCKQQRQLVEYSQCHLLEVGRRAPVLAEESRKRLPDITA